MKNQFYYTITEGDKSYEGNFNVNKLIRGITNEDGTRTVILDDFNERVTQQPDINPRNGRVNGTKNVRETVQSQITLSKEDAERLKKLTSIE